MKITNVVGRTVQIPLPRPIALGGAVVHARDYVVVRVDTDEGLSGVGFGFARGALIAQTIELNLKPVLVGEDPLMTSQLWQRMADTTRLCGHGGVNMRAISAVDIALWDIRARAAAMPLYKLLGGHATEVPAVATGGYIYAGDDPASSGLSEMAEYAADGFDYFKLMVGAQDWLVDSARIRRLRQELGPSARIAIDLNGTWTDPKHALRRLRDLADCQVFFVEEPFPMEMSHAIQGLGQASATPIAVGEFVSDQRTFLHFFAQQAIDISRQDATLVGGITAWMRIAALASSWTIPIFPHWFPEIHIHLAAAIPNTLAVEWIDPRRDVMVIDRILRSSLTCRRGLILLPDGPGLGIEVDWDAVAHYAA